MPTSRERPKRARNIIPLKNVSPCRTRVVFREKDADD
jgi:hypothetical protein